LLNPLMSLIQKGIVKAFIVAKALTIMHINCPALKGGAIENQPLTGL